MNSSPKHIHIIGICGVATSALAISFHDKGWKVTGSDKGFFPPVSTELEKHSISFYAGWHPENIGNPDIVVIGTASGTLNPETAYIKEKNIPMYSFAEAIGKFFVKEYSIVATGTWGKTSSSALLSFILEKAELNPTYMFGGVSLSHSASAKLTDSKYSVFEGDEYKSSPTDNTPKFVYYKPTHLLLSAVSWDHADLYPTEENYFDAFKNLISKIPTSGFIVANKDNEKVKELVKDAIWYGKDTEAKYIYSDVQQSKDGLKFKINNLAISSPMIGTFQAENITGCFAMAKELGIKDEIIVKAISEFKGLKRRLEKRLEGEITVFDDIAHSPEKASSVLENLRKIYTGKIITIFEPNIGGRNRESNIKYDNAFKNSDIVIIPRLTKLKISEDKEAPMDGFELASTILKTHLNTKYIENDEELVKYLIENTKTNDIIVFLGSHGFRGMIEETIKKLS
jgi:UDP-N-acetylmuramate: L-alanyl-gamma-D-glutamyl-meso-diaminopimelate ligase